MHWKRVQKYLEISLAMIFWSASFIWYKEAYQYLEPISLVFFRLMVSATFLFGLILITGQLEKIKKNDIPIFLLLALVEPLIYFLGESFGMKLVSPTVGSVIISTIPLFTPLAAWIIYKERFSWLKTVGITISFIGILFVIIGPGFKLIAPIAGVALLFVAVIAAVCHSVIIAYLIPKYKILTIILAQSALGLVYFLPIFILTELPLLKDIDLSWGLISPVIKLGVFPSSLSFILYARTVKIIGITRSNVFINFIPVFTALMSFIILKEQMSFGKILGILIVLTGLFASQSEGLRRKALKASQARLLR